MERPEDYCLTTIGGLVLETSYTLGDYGLGSILLTWQLQLWTISQVENRDDVHFPSHVEVALPVAIDFLGVPRILVPATPDTLASEVLDYIRKEYHLRDDSTWRLQCSKGLPLCPSEPLRLHRFHPFTYRTSHLVLALQEETGSASPLRTSRQDRHKSFHLSRNSSTSQVNLKRRVLLERSSSWRSTESLLESPVGSPKRESSAPSVPTIPSPPEQKHKLDQVVGLLGTLTTEQLAAVQNFIQVLKEPGSQAVPTPDHVGPIFHQRYDNHSSLDLKIISHLLW